MNISSQTNISSPVHAEQKTVTAEQNSNNSSSKDLASVSSTPAVKVTLSVSENAQAASNAALPQLYSRISLTKSNQEQLYVDDDQRAAPFEAEEGFRTIAFDAEGLDRDVQTSSDGEESGPVVNGEADNTAEQGREKAQQEALIEEQVAELKARDQEVRAHEQAHKSAGGQYAGTASFSYQTGPDGQRYAVGGEVPIDVAPIPNDPQATISKMNTVKAAANAPAEPSAQDRAVAAEAQRMITEAQADLAAEKREEIEQAKETVQERESVMSSVQEFERVAGLGQETTPDIDDLI